MVEEINEYENIDLFQNPENLTNINEIKEKIRRSGLIYISNIPLGMTVNSFRKLLGDYGIERIYLVPLPEKISDENGKKIQGYKEGWIEFEDKIFAKLCEYQLNGKPIGGNKKCPYKDDLWTIKYLHKFKWHHLIEKLNFNKNLREKRIKNEIRQGKRENEFMLKMYEKSKMLNKKREKEENKINEDLNEENDLEKIRKKFKQKKPIINNNNNNK